MYIEIRAYGIRLNILALVGLVFVFLLNGVASSLVMLLAAILHELGHILAANAVGAPIVRFDIEPWGGRMYYGGMTSYKQELLIASGGVAFNFLFAPIGLIPLFGIYGKLFFFSCVCYALVNLIPAKTLDGGEMLRCLLCMQKGSIGAESAERAVYLLSLIFMLALGATLCLITGFNLSVVFLCLFSLVITVLDYAKKPA